MTQTVEAVVIGAGVVGLAIARALAIAGRETLILEAASSFGSEISSRNSEVIHAGLYYPTGSLKARLCLAGRDQLYAYCASRGVAHARLGKLIVASEPAQVPVLQNIQALGEAESHGAALALNSPVRGGAVKEDGFLLDVGGAAPMRLDCRYLVNAAGL